MTLISCSGSDDATTPIVVVPSGLGAHALEYARFGSTVAQVSAVPLTAQATGSTLIVSVGRGEISGHRPPTDNRGNTFVQQGTAHAYTRYAFSGTALYAAPSVSGGSNHIVTTSHVSGDETTMAVVEVPGGGSITQRWSEVLVGNPLTSKSIVATGPAKLIAFWWRDADGSVPHTVAANNGFTVIDSFLDSGNLVQRAVAVKTVLAAGLTTSRGRRRRIRVRSSGLWRYSSAGSHTFTPAVTCIQHAVHRASRHRTLRDCHLR